MKRVKKEQSTSGLNQKFEQKRKKLAWSSSKFLFFSIFKVGILLALGFVFRDYYSSKLDKNQELDKFKTKVLIIKNETNFGLKEQPFKQESCGNSFYENNLKSLKIINGFEAVPHSQPWIISLRSINEPGFLSSHICGGSLITNQHVLTAAHCVTSLNAKSTVILAGIHDLNEINSDNVYFAESIQIHEKYTGDGASYIANDLAIIKLTKPIIRTDKIQTICLPQSNENIVNRNMITSGWGNIFDGFGSQVPDRLQWASLKVINGDPICDSSGFWDSNGLLCVIEPTQTPDTNVCFGNFSFQLI